MPDFKMKTGRGRVFRTGFIAVYCCILGLFSLAITAAGEETPLGKNDPVEFLSKLLDEKQELPNEGRRALTEALSGVFSQQDARVPYEQMSRIRKQRLCDFIKAAVERYPKGPYDTQLQREARHLGFKLGLQSFFNGPVFVSPPSQELDGQIGRLANWFAEEAKRKYPDIAGSSIPDELTRRIARFLKNSREDDMTPAMKYALSDKEFEAHLAALKKTIKDIPALGLYDNGHFTIGWEDMGSVARSKYLAENADSIVMSIEGALLAPEMEVLSAYAQSAITNQYSKIDLSIPVDPDEAARANDLGARAAAQLHDIQKRVSAEAVQEARKEDLLESVAATTDEIREVLVEPKTLEVTEDTLEMEPAQENRMNADKEGQIEEAPKPGLSIDAGTDKESDTPPATEDHSAKPVSSWSPLAWAGVIGACVVVLAVVFATRRTAKRRKKH